MRFFFILLLSPFFAQGQNEIYHVEKGQEGFRYKRYQTYLYHFKRAAKLADHHPWMQSELAKAYLLNGKKKKAIKSLKQIVKINAGMDFSNDSILQPLITHPDYQLLKQQLDKNLIARSTSQLAFQTKDPFLVPEGICYDEKEDIFYLGSIHQKKIVAIDQKGQVSDFCKSGSNGLWSVLGMTIDTKRRHLWACSPIGEDGDSLAGNAGIFKFDLDTKQFIQSYWLEKQDNTKHLFNDIVITSNGDAYFTDSEAGAIYTIPNQSNRLELFLTSEQLSYPNGIALNPEETFLFVSTVGKLYRINLNTKKMEAIKKSKTLFLGSFDGLYWYKDGLLGIQNSFRPTRIIRLKLNAKQNKVMALDELERNAPHYFVPTTGVIAKDHFYYISNSYINQYSPKKELKKEDFGPAKIYRISLIR